MAHSPDHALAPASAAPSGIPSAVPAALRPMSAVPVAELPPLRPLPTNDPYSPVATGQALFCAVFNVTFSTLLAWLASVPQHLIQQVRQTFSSPSPSPSPSQSQSAEFPSSSHPSYPSYQSHPSYPSLSERILLACRSLYRLLRVYHTFSSYWDRVTPRQLGLLSRAAGAINAFSGRSFDFSYWADLAGRPPRSYSFASSVAPSPDLPLAPASPVAPSPSPPVAPSSSVPPSPCPQVPLSASPPFPEWPFTALTAYKASFTMAPGRLLAQVCQDLARLTQSPSPDPSELESPSPSPSQSAVALSSQSLSPSHSQSTPSIESIRSIRSIGSIPSISSTPSTPSTPSPSTLDNGPLTLAPSHSSHSPP